MSLVIMFKDKEIILCFNFIFSIMCPSPMHTWVGSAQLFPHLQGAVLRGVEVG